MNNKLTSHEKYGKYRTKKAKKEKSLFRDFFDDYPTFFLGSIILACLLLFNLIVSIVGK